MQTYEFDLGGAGNVKASGMTQPRPSGSDDKNPGSGSGGTSVVGSSTPVIVATGAENNG